MYHIKNNLLITYGQLFSKRNNLICKSSHVQNAPIKLIIVLLSYHHPTCFFLPQQHRFTHTYSNTHSSEQVHTVKHWRLLHLTIRILTLGGKKYDIQLDLSRNPNFTHWAFVFGTVPCFWGRYHDTLGSVYLTVFQLPLTITLVHLINKWLRRPTSLCVGCSQTQLVRHQNIGYIGNKGFLQTIKQNRFPTHLLGQFVSCNSTVESVPLTLQFTYNKQSKNEPSHQSLASASSLLFVHTTQNLKLNTGGTENHYEGQRWHLVSWVSEIPTWLSDYIITSLKRNTRHFVWECYFSWQFLPYNLTIGIITIIWTPCTGTYSYTVVRIKQLLYLQETCISWGYSLFLNFKGHLPMSTGFNIQSSAQKPHTLYLPPFHHLNTQS